MDTKEKKELIEKLRDIASSDVAEYHPVAAHPCTHAADELEREAGKPTQDQVDRAFFDTQMRERAIIKDIDSNVAWRRDNLAGQDDHAERIKKSVALQWAGNFIVLLGVLVLAVLADAVRALAG